jgi:predicted porin
MQVNKILAAAVLCALGTSAYAQSNVTVFGFIEAQVGRETQAAPGTKLFDMGGSRLGFKGTEDLGGGNSAEFYLEHRLNPDDGTVGGGATFWKGGSWVGLSSKTAGSVKLGRWWSQSFLKAQYAADPFGMGTLGEGSYPTVGCAPQFGGNLPKPVLPATATLPGSAGCLGAFWMNNSVSYENAFGPVSFGVQYGVEAAAGAKHPANVGVSYAAGPLYLGLGYETSNDGSKDEDWASFAANYDFGAAKLYAGYGSGQDSFKIKRKDAIVGFSAPVGAGAIIGSYNVQKNNGVKIESKLALGYKYNLSKRTNVFAVVANDNKAPVGTNKSGYAVGMFHAF